MDNQENKIKARRWVNGYTAAGTVIVVAAVIPGSTSAALIAMEVTMCYQIGKIYRGDGYTLEDAARAAKIIGLVAITAQIIALEALDFVPFAGWAVKGGLAGGVIKAMGESVIAYYEKQDRLDSSRMLASAAPVIDVSAVTVIAPMAAPLALPAASENSVHDRLQKLNSLLDKKLISQAEYDAKRQQILSEL
jgi:uncharacterized protein (DUF697 family)